MTRRTRIAALLSAAALVAVTGCAGGNNDDKASSDEAPALAPQPAAGDSGSTADESAADFDSELTAASRAEAFDAQSGDVTGARLNAGLDPGSSAPADAPAATPDKPLARKVISRASLRVSTARITQARERALDIVSGLGGHVSDEKSTSDDKGGLKQVDLTMRVPVLDFDEALAKLADLGTLRSRKQSSEDVTTQYIDNDARIRTQRASVESVRQLLRRATSLREIMAVEAQLRQRQAQLNSLEGQQRYLSEQTDLSVVHLRITRPEDEKKADEDKDDNGFLGGLSNGWEALGDSFVVASTGVGAVLPFAVLLALVGAPAWAFRKRWLRARGQSVA